MEIKKVLLRLGSRNLINLIDEDVFKILKIRNVALNNQKNLTDLVLKLQSGRNILINSNTREIIFDALKSFEAELLAELFHVDTENPWTSLKKVNFKNKKNFEKLLDVFDIPNQDTTDNTREEDRENPKKISPSYALFPHQIEVMKKTLKLLKKDTKKCIMHMPTGAGKTRTAINLICDYLKKKDDLVIWLAHTEELCQQAYDEFNKGWKIIGNREVESFKLFKNFRLDIEKITKGFLVMSLDYAYSLTKKSQNLFFKLSRKCNFVIMDEAHMSIAPSYKQVLDLLVNNKTNLLGLTATPGRAGIDDEENENLANFFNKQKSTLYVEGFKSPIHFLEKKGYLAKVIPIKLESNIDIKKIFSKTEIDTQLKRIRSGQDLSKEFVKKISSNEKRVNMIIEAAIKESKIKNNKIIIFAGSLETAESINKMLLLEGVKSALISGETNLAERRYNIEKFKEENEDLKILVNYGVLTTGFDAPKANVAIIGRPTQSVTLYSQMVGRVMRGKEAGGKSQCKVITVKDPVYGFRDMSESFFYWEELWN